MLFIRGKLPLLTIHSSLYSVRHFLWRWLRMIIVNTAEGYSKKPVRWGAYKCKRLLSILSWLIVAWETDFAFYFMQTLATVLWAKETVASFDVAGKYSRMWWALQTQFDCPNAIAWDTLVLKLIYESTNFLNLFKKVFIFIHFFIFYLHFLPVFMFVAVNFHFFPSFPFNLLWPCCFSV